MPIAPDVVLGPRVRIPQPDLVNLYGCRIGADSVIGAFVEIQKGVTVGARCKVSSHSFLCEGVTLEDEVFVGHGVMFTNDRHPRAAINGHLKSTEDWSLTPTVVQRGAAIGSGSVLLPGVTVGEGAMIGAGSVVTKNVAPWMIAAGNPARAIGRCEGK